jgi:hypothetical protein
MKKLNYGCYPYDNCNNKFLKVDAHGIYVVTPVVHLEYLLNLKELNKCTL